MSVRSDGRPPFRADHVGSLLRPQTLRQAFRRRAGNEIGDDEFARIQDECIRAAVRMQEEIGLEVTTDGEFRRGSYWGRFVQRTEGLEVRPALLKFRDDHGHELDFTAPYATAPIRRTHALALDEFVFLRAVTGVTAKVTLPAPSTMHFLRFSDFADRAAYADVDRFFVDLVGVFRQEIADLVERAADTYRSTRSPLRCCVTARSATGLRAPAAIPMRWSSAISTPSTARSRAVRATSSSASICAAATSEADISPMADTSRLPSASSRVPMRATFCSNTTRRGRATCAAALRAEGEGGRAWAHQQQDAGT
jgi:hypothetical protein